MQHSEGEGTELQNKTKLQTFYLLGPPIDSTKITEPELIESAFKKCFEYIHRTAQFQAKDEIRGLGAGVRYFDTFEDAQKEALVQGRRPSIVAVEVSSPESLSDLKQENIAFIYLEPPFSQSKNKEAIPEFFTTHYLDDAQKYYYLKLTSPIKMLELIDEITPMVLSNQTSRGLKAIQELNKEISPEERLKEIKDIINRETARPGMKLFDAFKTVGISLSYARSDTVSKIYDAILQNDVNKLVQCRDELLQAQKATAKPG